MYLYQRWIYPIDKKRVNEFGQEFDHDELPALQADQNPDLSETAGSSPVSPLLTERSNSEKEKGSKKSSEIESSDRLRRTKRVKAS